MICVENGTKSDDVLQLITSAGHTRLPIYEENVDNIRGILHAKDLLRVMDEASETIDPAPPWPANPILSRNRKRSTICCENSRRKRIHMAIIVDEYGGTAGLVTLEDLLEENRRRNSR